MKKLLLMLPLLLAGCGLDSPGDQAVNLSNAILQNGAAQLQADLTRGDPNGAATMDDVNCVETGDSQSYTCLAHYTVVDVFTNLNQKYALHIDGSCDDTANCQWHPTGTGKPVPG